MVYSLTYNSGRIVLSAIESQSQWQQEDYKGIPQKSDDLIIYVHRAEQNLHEKPEKQQNVSQLKHSANARSLFSFLYCYVLKIVSFFL
jgi:hypothetical protein